MLTETQLRNIEENLQEKLVPGGLLRDCRAIIAELLACRAKYEAAREMVGKWRVRSVGLEGTLEGARMAAEVEDCADELESALGLDPEPEEESHDR